MLLEIKKKNLTQQFFNSSCIKIYSLKTVKNHFTKKKIFRVFKTTREKQFSSVNEKAQNKK